MPPAPSAVPPRHALRRDPTASSHGRSPTAPSHGRSPTAPSHGRNPTARTNVTCVATRGRLLSRLVVRDDVPAHSAGGRRRRDRSRVALSRRPGGSAAGRGTAPRAAKFRRRSRDCLPSQQDDGAAEWIQASLQTGQRILPPDWEVRHESVPGDMHERAVVARVSEQQDDVVDSTVPSLQGKSSLEPLRVPSSRLSFDADPHIGEQHERIPCTLVSRCRDWHLGPPACSRPEPRSQALEQFEVRAIAHRSAARVRADTEVQTHHGSSLGQCDQREPRCFTALEPTPSDLDMPMAPLATAWLRS